MSHRAAHALVGTALAVLVGLWLSGLAGLPACPFASYLAVLCPMCGSGRAIEAAVSGEVANAFRLNPLFPLWGFVMGLFLLDMVWAVRFGADVHGPGRRLLNAGARNRWSLGLLVVLWIGMAVYLNLFMRAELLPSHG